MLLRAKDIRAAESTRDLDPLPWSADPAENLARVEEFLRARGYRIVEKGPREPGRRLTTTLPPIKQIRGSHGWHDRDVAYRARVLAHEAVHVRQPVKIARWPSARYRLQAETPAYRETLRISWAQGDIVGHAALLESIDRIVANLRKTYFIGRLDSRPLVTARRILCLDWHSEIGT